MAKSGKEIDKKILGLIDSYNPNGEWYGKTDEEKQEFREKTKKELSESLSPEEINDRIKKTTVQYGVKLGTDHYIYQRGKEAFKDMTGTEIQDKELPSKLRLMAEDIGDRLKHSVSKLRNKVKNKSTNI